MAVIAFAFVVAFAPSARIVTHDPLLAGRVVAAIGCTFVGCGSHLAAPKGLGNQAVGPTVRL
jgi:hypothetical protein